MKISTLAILKLTALSIACLTLSVTTSCGSSDETARQQTVSGKVKDKKAYHLGEEHACKLLEQVADEDAVQDELLEIRARISNIGSKLGAQAAADYERGFTDYIRANNDSLARLLF
ncbi:MAG: hypothetical protein K2H17_03245 [Duncaniella sp.]|uniref:hypothetical protein n=1 Tax=Duncaniella sp. TaxID=2518496 RepID=UPI0023D122D4|nr:hypothetical protein [Duncaniella sp.]MDE5988394.1 hypothetical protein [Duncaniella sp.]